MATIFGPETKHRIRPGSRSLRTQDSCTHLVLTLCGLTSQKTHQGGLGLGGSVHEEAHPRFPYLIQTSFGLTGSDCPNRLDIMLA